MTRPRRIERVRNIGIVAHVDAGKTTLTERILFLAGRIHRQGETHEGTTTTDFSPIEQRRGITIASAAVSLTWREHRIHLIDTPGHVDFSVEVERSLRVLDGAVFVLDAKEGVECQTEGVWHKADVHDVPRIVFVNKMDKLGADFDACVASVGERLGATPLPVQIPLGQEAAFEGLVDVVAGRAIVFDEPTGRDYRVLDVPARLRDAAMAARAKLVEACADVDERVMDAFVRGDSVTTVDLVRALRKGTLARRFVPVLCGAAYKNKGVQMLLDAVVDYLPSPRDLSAEPFSALAFKTLADRNGHTTLLRVYSGRLGAGDVVLCSRSGKRERALRIYEVFADRREPVDEALTGSIVAAAGLTDVRTGDTLCDPKHPVVLESISFPEPVVEAALEPATSKDQDKLGLALSRMLVEDPSLAARVDDETGQTILGGMGLLHLEVVCERLLEEQGVHVTITRPEVACRETVLQASRADYRHVKQSGGPGQFARVVLEIAPAARGAGLTFVDETKGGAIPAAFIPAIEKGIRASASRGVVAAHPLVDVQVRLVDGEAHVKDSSPLAFETCASFALREAARAARPVVLEPHMALEIIVPKDFTGDTVGDLASRRGAVREVLARGVTSVVTGTAPLRCLFGYVAELRNRTEGRGTATMRMSHYERVP
jgi:elongation factor G